MDIRNKHLSSEDRGVILAEHNRGSSQRLIGQLLHLPASTICRELARGRQEDGFYCPQAARQAYDARRALPPQTQACGGERPLSFRSWQARTSALVA